MLSERDRRVLAEIEHQIARQDPHFVASMQVALPDRRGRWARRGYDLIIALGAGTAALCLVLLLICAAVVVILLVVATCYFRAAHLGQR